METIGVVGLGHMGGNMAARFLEAGYTVQGTADGRDGTEWLVEKGLTWRDTPREIAAACDFVLTSLPDDGVVRSVGGGPNGLVAGLGEGKVWIDLSTISPRVSREMATMVASEGHGATMLDAPVSGSVPQVQTGTLTIMVGGEKAAYERVEPALRVLGTPTHVGENGQGLALKLAINISLGVQMLAFSEGLLLAERDGLDPKLAAKVMSDSPIGSPMLKARVPLVLGESEATWFDIGLMHKDIRLALATAAELGVPSPTAETADRELTEAEELGFEHRDIAAMLEALAKRDPDRTR